MRKSTVLSLPVVKDSLAAASLKNTRHSKDQRSSLFRLKVNDEEEKEKVMQHQT
jgi:hypothetical protein